MALKVSLFIVVAVLMAGIAAGFYNALPKTNSTMAPASISSLTIGTTTINVEVADTEATREQGLSGRAGLPAGGGMLFVFDTPGKYGFWMKDMSFSLDMLFINASGTVVTIAPNATPEGYHQSPPEVFYPTEPASYVLEVPAGFAKEHGISEGSTVVFK